MSSGAILDRLLTSQGSTGFESAGIKEGSKSKSKSKSGRVVPTTPRMSQRPLQSLGTGASSGTNQSNKSLDLPPYEEMIYRAISDLKQEAGSAPKAILDWVQA